MPRLASALLVVGLLVATAAAFAVTERLKLVRSPILGTELDRRVFSPVCGCESNSVNLGFRLRRADAVTVTIVAADGGAVRTLLRSERRQAGPVAVRWDGRGDDGTVVPEGTYKPRVHLDDQRRTIELPNPMRVDTTPPGVLAFTVRPRAFSPDGDGRRDKARVHFELSEEGRAQVSVDGRVRVRNRRNEAEGGLDFHGGGLGPGRYTLVLEAVDRAGNIGGPVEAAVTIRYIELTRDAFRVRPGTHFRARVVTDAASYSWRLAGSRGRSSAAQLRLRAPRQPGRYALVVEANGRRARAEVVVRAG